MRKIIGLAVLCVLYVVNTSSTLKKEDKTYKIAETVLKKQALLNAKWALTQEPVTITSSSSPRSFGGKHDFFSEADYFWPNPENPDGAYKEIDGVTNPDNFVAHREAMLRFSQIIGALASAYKITGDDIYVKHAVRHLKAWFIDAETLMNPNLEYAQAVFKHQKGRSWGIIDTIHFMEVAQGVIVMESSKSLDKNTLNGIKKWFSEYITWLNTSKNGVAEKLSKNNHSTCWVMQVASFAKLCKDETMLDSLRARYKEVLLPNQMAEDGGFPLELRRTKPYGYSIFNLDAMATICQILSTPKDNLWNYKTADGRSIKKGIQFLYPYVETKSSWTLKPDVMYWEDWPVAQPFLIFGAQAFNENDWLKTWERLEHFPQVTEVIRNLPIRNPLIWL